MCLGLPPVSDSITNKVIRNLISKFYENELFLYGYYPNFYPILIYFVEILCFYVQELAGRGRK